MFFLILTGLSLLMIWVATKSGLLRNEIFNLSNLCKIAQAEGRKDPKPAFSLGRTQLAFWTTIIISSFIYIAITKSNGTAIHIPVISGVNLALLGIASGTTIVAKVIDSSQMSTQGDIIPQQDHPSKNFFIDIISDEKGVSIHRLQNVIWTFVVGAAYVWFVYLNVLLPTESTITPELLALMGISTGAYLGLKTVENQAEPASSTYVNTNKDAEASQNTSAQTPLFTTRSNGQVAELANDDVSNSAQHDY